MKKNKLEIKSPKIIENQLKKKRIEDVVNYYEKFVNYHNNCVKEYEIDINSKDNKIKSIYSQLENVERKLEREIRDSAYSRGFAAGKKGLYGNGDDTRIYYTKNKSPWQGFI